MTTQSNATNSLAHTKWNCKYNIVFATKYRRKVFYSEKRDAIRNILRQLCQWKGVEIIGNWGRVTLGTCLHLTMLSLTLGTYRSLIV